MLGVFAAIPFFCCLFTDNYVLLRWRLILSAPFIAGLVGLCWLDATARWPGVYLLPLAVVLSLAAAGELLAMFRQRDHQPASWAVYGGTLITVLATAAPQLWQFYSAENPVVEPLGGLALGLMAGMLLAAVAELRRFESPGHVMTNLALSCFAVLYAGGLMGFLVGLRLLSGGPWGDDGRWGMVALVSLVATVKMSDVGQYTVGRLLGKHKLAPRVSPGKTWEGAAGGIVFAIVSAWVVLRWGENWIGSASAGDAVPIGQRLPGVLGFAVVVAVIGMVGDLAASLLKRDAGVKDSSRWMPGFGGVVDLLDSLLAAAPAAYLLWTLRLVGP